VTRSSLVGAGVAVLLLAAALRLPGLDKQRPVWTDEGLRVEAARWPVPVLLTAEDPHPPLFGLILKHWIVGTLRPARTLGLGHRRHRGGGGDARARLRGRGGQVAVLAALILAIAPLHVVLAPGPHVLVGRAVQASPHRGSSCVRSATAARRRWTGYAGSAVGLLTHYLYATVVLAQAVFVVLRRVALGRVALVGGALLVLATIAASILGRDAVGLVSHRRSFEWLSVPYTALVFVGGFGLGPPVELLHRDRSVATIAPAFAPGIAAVAVLGVVLVWGALRALPVLGAWGLYLVLWLVIPAVVVFAGAWVRDGAFNVRYLLAAFPAFVLLAAIAIDRMPRPYALACLAALVALSTLSIARDRFDPRYARDDLRGAAHWLRTHAGADAPVTVSASYSVFGLRHYDGALHLEPLAIRPVSNAEEANVLLDGLSGRWLVLVREWEDDPAGYLDRAIAARAPDAQAARFPGVRIFRFAPTAAPR
jgi:hypothetical protein